MRTLAVQFTALAYGSLSHYGSADPPISVSRASEWKFFAASDHLCGISMLRVIVFFCSIENHFFVVVARRSSSTACHCFVLLTYPWQIDFQIWIQSRQKEKRRRQHKKIEENVKIGNYNVLRVGQQASKKKTMHEEVCGYLKCKTIDEQAHNKYFQFRNETNLFGDWLMWPTMTIGDRIRILNRLWFLVGIKECLASFVFVCLYFFLFWHCVYHAVTGIHFAVHLRCRKEETQNLSIIVCHECNLTLEATN